MIRTNYHTHTYRCKHADGDIHDYCQAAVNRGLTTLGFSDHAPLPDRRWSSVRMDMDQLQGYCDAIDQARVSFPQLTIHKGLELEYLPEYSSFFREVFLGEFDLDYLLGGSHWYPHEGDWLPIYGQVMDRAMLRSYTDYLIAGMQSGLYAAIAHPDLFGNAYLVWDESARDCSRAILRTAAELDLPLEINAYGLRKPPMDTPEGRRHKYPWLPFWELAASCGTPVMVNSDAHTPGDVVAKMDEAMAMAKRFDLRIIETLRFPASFSDDSSTPVRV